MDDNIMDDNMMDNNNIDDISGAGDDWTAEEETHLTQAWLLHLLNGPDSIKVQNIIYPLLRDMEFTGDDFERVSTDLQKLGTNRDAGEIKDLFTQWMLDCENRINEGILAEDEEPKLIVESEEASGGDGDKIMSKL